MRKRETEMLLAYLYNKSVALENNLIECKNILRYRNTTEIDMLEMIIAQTEYRVFTETCKDINAILKLFEAKNLEK